MVTGYNGVRIRNLDAERKGIGVLERKGLKGDHHKCLLLLDSMEIAFTKLFA